jgi:hypothetical protein
VSGSYCVVREQHDSTTGRTSCELLLLRRALSALQPRETVGSKTVRLGPDSVLSAKSVSGTCDYTCTPARVYVRVFPCTRRQRYTTRIPAKAKEGKRGEVGQGAKRGEIKQNCSGMDTRVQNLLVQMICLRISLFEITSEEITDAVHVHVHLRAQTLHLR